MASRSAFISYQRGDVDHAAYLYERLCHHGIRTWWDQAIVPGDDWRERIATKLEQSALFIVLHSAESEKSREVRNEIAAAAALDKTIIAIRLEKRPPRGVFLYEMAAINWVDAFDDPHAALDELASRLGTLPALDRSRLTPEMVGAQPFHQPLVARLLASNPLLISVWGIAVLVGFACLEAMGEGVSGMATENGATLTDVSYALGAAAVGAPVLILRFILQPPRTIIEAGALAAAVMVLATYLLLARNLIRKFAMSGRSGWRRPA